jgi:predicted AlkP superfamily pyrophosphatase or phosphodiesterase
MARGNAGGHRAAARRALAFALLCAGALACSSQRAQPALVVLLVVDQLGANRVTADLPGGLGRLVREGRVWRNGAHDHGLTETCPGHVAIATGRHPAAAGIPSNEYIERSSGREIYCVEDPAETARVIGGSEGRSPRNIRSDALGDWLKAARPETRVFSVAGKDRSAIALGGQRADAAYWIARRGAIGFTTSRYYRPELPAWVRDFNGSDAPRDGFWTSLPELWEHATTGAPPSDDYRFESPRYGRTSGHPLNRGALEERVDQLYAAPHLDLVTLDFAARLVREEQLGRGAGPDLLAVSLSGFDTVGHLYGPDSLESRDALARIDAALASFLETLERELGSGRILLALSADHGVLPLPEWLTETGASRCPVPGGRTSLEAVSGRLRSALDAAFAPALAKDETWLHFAGPQIVVDRALAERRGVPVASVAGVAKRVLEDEPAIAKVWTPEELAGEDAIAVLYRHSLDPERSGDLVVQVAETCLVSGFPDGTTHGSPWLYDRAVPIVLFGAGVTPGSVDTPARTIDIAPTLARRVGVEPPADRDGRDLLE